MRPGHAVPPKVPVRQLYKLGPLPPEVGAEAIGAWATKAGWNIRVMKSLEGRHWLPGTFHLSCLQRPDHPHYSGHQPSGRTFSDTIWHRAAPRPRRHLPQGQRSEARGPTAIPGAVLRFPPSLLPGDLVVPAASPAVPKHRLVPLQAPPSNVSSPRKAASLLLKKACSLAG